MDRREPILRPRRLAFGEFELDLQSHELFRQGEAVKLQPQPARLLTALASRPGQLWSREELQKELWSEDHHVDFDQGLNYGIKQIRRALGETSSQPVFLETVPRRGYRFRGPVRELPEPEAPKGSSRRPWLWVLGAVLGLVLLAGLAFRGGSDISSEESERQGRLVVLPVENLSGEESRELLADHLTAELISELTRASAGELGVIARRTAQTYRDTSKGAREIGEEISVGFLLEGSVLGDDGQDLRLAVHLVRTEDATTRWSETFMVPVETGGAGLSTRIARAVVEELGVGSDSSGSSPAPPPVLPPKVYETYVEARQALGSRDLARKRESLDLIRSVVRRAPGFAPGYLALAAAHLRLGAEVENGSAEALEAMERAMELDPGFAEAHFAYGSHLFFRLRDREGGLEALARGLEVSPRHAEGHHALALALAAQGELEEAIHHAEQAAELDPLSSVVHQDRGWIYFFAGRYEEARRHSRRAIEMGPSPAWARAGAFHASVALGEAEEALRDLRPLLAAGPGTSTQDAPTQVQTLEDVWRLQTAPDSKAPPVSRAVAYLELGEPEKALEALERLCEIPGSWQALYLEVDPRLDSIRAEPRFGEVVGCVKGFVP